MNEIAEDRSLLTSSSSLTSLSSKQTWLPSESLLSWMNNRQMEQDSRHQYVETQSSPAPPFFEELFCTSSSLAPLAGALLASKGPQSDVVKRGYLGKLELKHRRYFVLRAGSHIGPSRLEWYQSQEKFTAVEKTAGSLFGSSKQGVIYLRCCVGVSRSGSSGKGLTVALCAKSQTVVLVVEEQGEQEEWYLAIKKLMEEERKDEEHGEGFDEDDDGYCTLPPAAFFKEVWPVAVKPRGLGCTKSLAGESCLCLTASSLILARAAAGSDLPSVTIPLLSVRRFGHLDGAFFLELGRSAPNGPGEIWMEAREQGSLAVAQHIHEVVRETVRALRALPDFSRSPTSNHQLQTLLVSKGCRPKHRDKPAGLRPLASRARNPESPCKCPHETDPHQSSESRTGGYMEMKMDQHLPLSKERERVSQTPPMLTEEEDWESGQQGLGYMVMSPQLSHSLSALPQNDYVTMASPQKPTRPSSSSSSSPLQTSFNSSTSESSSPLHHQTHWLLATSVQQSEAETGQSKRSISHAQDEEMGGQWQQIRLPAHTSTRRDDGSDVMTPLVSGVVSPNCGRLKAATERSVRRCRLSLCLPSCLQAEDRNK
ncbi:insulin receptor substrate 2-B-like [Notothenia coriiceps]|uniref:Insulin receptor substrate 2-B-like n=1 Tax=Notothenia coriiceps TaxID=8208 RepID=A0A6I9NHR0_9TELE|nr:PREDICTED: insulin receptor substrate 2-B-like [Notothenia coriiceps]